MEGEASATWFWKAVTAGMLLLFAGVAVIMFAALLAALRGGKGEVGGVIVIGPIPIVFGTSGDAVKVAVIGAIVLMVLAVVLMYLLPLVLTKRMPLG